MPVPDLLTLALLLALVTLITPFLGRYIAAVIEVAGIPPWCACSGPWSARCTLRGDRPGSRAGLARVRPVAAGVQPAVDLRAVPPAAVPGVAAPRPDRRTSRAPGPCAQHGSELHHQHELAETTGRRDRDGAPHAGRRLTVRSLVSRSRSRSFRGITRRLSPTIGNFWVDVTRLTSTSCCRSQSLPRSVLVWQRVPRRGRGQPP